MNDPEELYNAIVASNLEFQRVLVRTVEIVAVNHPLAISNDPNIAFSEILSTCIPELKIATDPYAASKLFTSSKRDKLLPSIDIKTLDNSLLLNILIKVDGFLEIIRIAGKCSSPNHVAGCCNNCTINCDHSSPTCKKCQSNDSKPSNKCKHQCKLCNKAIDECNKDIEICCSKCNLCVMCNEKFTTAHMMFLSHRGSPAIQEPCRFYLFLHCFEILLNWRRLFGHITVAKLKEFIDGKMKLDKFEMCKDPKVLFCHIRSTLLIISEYITDKAVFQKNLLNNDECNDFKENLNCISKFGKPLQVYLAEHEDSIKDLLKKLQEVNETKGK